MEKFIKKANSILWLTSGQAMIFDIDGNQIAELQKMFPSKDRELLRKIADQCSEHTVMYFREWSHLLTKEEFKSFLML